MTFFTGSDLAARYAASRPYFHPLVIERISQLLGGCRLSLALDVACGTGQSSRALADLAERVVGTDVSYDMLAAARRSTAVDYVAANAEQLPFASSVFPLVTVALAFHWFDRARFLAEAHRVLAPEGWLFIYNNSFLGKMRGNPAFADWLTGSYLWRYPTPPRDRQPFGDEQAARSGFRFVARQQYRNEVEFSRAELVRYLMTQTNVIAAAATGREGEDQIAGWLSDQLEPLFTTTERATFLFGGPIWILQRQ